jgi:hypothetical protein
MDKTFLTTFPPFSLSPSPFRQKGLKKELINLRNLNFCHDKVCIFKYLAYLCSDKFRSRGLLIASQFSQTNDEYPNCQ